MDAETPVQLTVRPVQAADQITITLQGLVQGQGNMFVTDITGRTVLSMTAAAEELQNEYVLDVSGLKPGVYALSYETNGYRRAARFVKN